MIDRSQLYIIKNENSSPVAIRTRTDSILVAGAENGDIPTTIPLTFDDIVYINSTSNAFKIGLLFFETEYEEDWYSTLKIQNWKNIMHNSEIEEILLNPSVDGLQKILDITNEQYFERVRGIFTGLKFSGADISVKVESLIRERYYEFSRKTYKTKIELKKNYEKENKSDKLVADLSAQVAALMKQVEELTAKSAQPVVEESKPTKQASSKTATKTTTNKSTGSKSVKPKVEKPATSDASEDSSK